MQVHEEMVRDALSDLADEDYQRRDWTSRTPSGQSSLEECWERLFDDSGLGTALDSETEVFGDHPDQCLRELDTALRAVPVDASASEVLDSEEMALVRSLASRTLGLLAD
ncbi:hypothetical protein [Pedococcus bigeumensis]|uniref:Uncharacterized protein n=1 Tax=Pedococcus bigeumensis TaxID=433644 RepID=A0A502CMS9_9MICO|nr:hypothetical protein [Pedococcus bigeumensis]TPG13924.1 hypothetical protein EAH86_16995 [Pedococcus bigeumensis]